MINGIKPDVSKADNKVTALKTELSGVDVSTFDKALNNLLDKLTLDGKENYKRYSHISDIVFRADGGRKFIKVKYFVEYTNDTVVGADKGSIHCFVDKTTGDIYKPATWKAPYTKGNNAVRGNIYKPDTYQKTDPHGGWLYAK